MRFLGSSPYAEGKDTRRLKAIVYRIRPIQTKASGKASVLVALTFAALFSTAVDSANYRSDELYTFPLGTQVALDDATPSYFAVGVVSSQQQIDAALSLPIIDGQSLAGVGIGDSEEEIIRKLGTTDKAGKYLRDGLEVTFMAYVASNRKVAIGLLLPERRVKAVWMTLVLRSPAPPSIGRTKKGVGLGDPVHVIQARYGPPTEGPDPLFKVCPWYRNEGLMFCPVEEQDGEVRVFGILLTEPGADVVPLLKMWGPWRSH